MTKDQESGGAPLEQLPDEALCRLIREQDRPAEEVLAARYHRVVRSCARPYFLAGGDSEDLMQEGMFGLIKAMREYFVEKYPRSGPQYTPIAFLMDFFSGWMPPSEPLPKRVSATGSIPL